MTKNILKYKNFVNESDENISKSEKIIINYFRNNILKDKKKLFLVTEELNFIESVLAKIEDLGYCVYLQNFYGQINIENEKIFKYIFYVDMKKNNYTAVPSKKLFGYTNDSNEFLKFMNTLVDVYNQLDRYGIVKCHIDDQKSDNSDVCIIIYSKIVV